MLTLAHTHTPRQLTQHLLLAMDDASRKVGAGALASATGAKIVAFGGAALYYGALPLVLLLAAGRRGLSWRDVASAAVRLPFV